MRDSGDPRVQIICGDIFDFQPQERFDYAWFDIWPAISPDNYPEMQRLHRRFARTATVRDSWCRRQCRRMYRAARERNQ